MLKLIKGSELLKNVMILMTGTVFAQVFSYAASTIISRLYNESEIADLGLYMRIVAFIAALATARFELSIPIPKVKHHSFLLYLLGLRIAKVVILSCFIFALLFFGLSFLNLSSFSLYALAIVSSYFVVLINLGTNWSIRNKLFKRISLQRMINSLSSNSLKIVFGYFSMGSFGLIIGTFLGYVISSFTFFKEFKKNKKDKDNQYSPAKTKVLFRLNKNFPLISLPHVLFDLGRDLLIAFLMVYSFGKDCFGSYYFALMMLSIPIAFIGQSIGQVFFNKCSEMINRGESTVGFLKKTFKTLFLLSIIPFSILFFYGEILFTFVFSSTWTSAGRYSEIMSIWMLFNFMISPISNLPIILNRQKENFVLGIIGSVLQLTAFGIMPFVIGNSTADFEMILWGLSLAQIILLVTTGALMLKYAKMGRVN
jgi:O-antigen/teichoic acid export membrane protein